MNARLLPVLLTVAVFVIAYALCGMQYPRMVSTQVIGNILTSNAYLGIVAVGMTFVIISGGIDLSVGAVIAFTGVFLAVTMEHYGLSPLAAFPLILLITALFGAAMGAIIHYLQTPAFIVTLAGMFLARGMCFVLSVDSVPVDQPVYDWLTDLAIRIPRTDWAFVNGGRFSFVAMVMVAVFIIGVVIAHWTRFGANVYALGGNRTSAELMGVPVARTTIAIYALSSTLAGVAGIVFSLYKKAGYSLDTVGTELDAIAAVVIGGTLLTGGYGFVFGTFVGVLIQGLIQTYIVFDGTLSSWWTKIAVGALLFVFIGLQRLLVRLSDRSADRWGSA
jgi:simple sugar transport system permease protein